MSSSSAYMDRYRESIEQPESFWGAAARDIDWIKEPGTVLDRSRAPSFRWFPGGTLNTCYNALDRHVLAGRGDRAALIYASPVTGTDASISYADLLHQVSRFAAVLSDRGVGYGDRVVVYMPMIPEAVVAMLACARIGAVHSVVFGGFAAPELAARIEDAQPKVIVAASCGIEPRRVVHYKPLLDAALARSTQAPAVIVKQRQQARADMIDDRDYDWDELMAEAAPISCVEVAATDPLYILYTSGTTGRPKGIVRDNGGHAVAMTWSLRNVYGVQEGDVWWAASDVGWVVGHSYIVYAPLLCGVTSVLFEGKPVGTPDAAAFWRVIAQHGVTSLLTAPTAIRAIRQADPHGTLLSQYDTGSLRALFLAGERLDPATFEWASDTLKVPVVDNWWQTETGWPIVANPVGLGPLRLKAGSPSVPMPGYDVRILDTSGEPARAGEEGAICVRLPLPPGTFTTVWNDEERFVRSYLSAFPGNYLTGDGGYIDNDGYVFVMGRTDDVINVAGHRLSAGAIEAAIGSHPSTAECAVIAVADDLKGHVPRALVVLKSDALPDAPRLRHELAARVRDMVGAIAVPPRIDVVDGLPKTRSGKILRRSMRDIADGLVVTDPATIEDAAVLDRLRPLLATDD